MPKKKTKQEHIPEYLKISDYIRRKHELMLERDPLAKPVQRSSISRAIERKEIIPHTQGKFKFIDWNLYKDFIFRQYSQMPVRKVASVK